MLVHLGDSNEWNGRRIARGEWEIEWSIEFCTSTSFCQTVRGIFAAQ
ncbi:helicase [Burkholderia thailandensis]|nr:helicase [Burkholderia thailandensis]MDD1480302.1 helicase [Burkholderia thailandensis]MDD1485290.1 helicase [Burkholderia thailandensis]MDD1495430.1 helicase [Burkholderia thailandensis]MDW9236562.1 superfamily II DNA and RNA helicase domain protein [Burkholderia thailandensis]